MEHDMTDEDMIGYVLDLLEPGERRSVEHYLSGHPAAADAVERVRQRLAVLSVDREFPQPPSGLALRTISRVAEFVVEHEPQLLQQTPVEAPTRKEVNYGLTPVEPSTLVEQRKPRRPRLLGWVRPDMIVTACIGIVFSGLVVAGLGRTRHHMGVVACQQNLSTLHKSLVSYSDTHEGRFPQVGTEAYPTAGHFSAALAKEHADPTKSGFTWHDPAEAHPDPMLVDAVRNGWKDEVPSKVQYAYSLGHLGPDGKLMGLRHHGGDGPSGDFQPIAGDLPSAAVSPAPGAHSPHRNGQNVLYVGGHVRFDARANLGLGGDDVYRNQSGIVAAGDRADDCVLGRPGDKPFKP